MAYAINNNHKTFCAFCKKRLNVIALTDMVENIWNCDCKGWLKKNGDISTFKLAIIKDNQNKKQ